MRLKYEPSSEPLHIITFLRYHISGDGARFDPKEVLRMSWGPTVERIRILATLGMQRYLAQKKPPSLRTLQ